ncbi:Beta-lactamase [Minicystis rosea]|nr:Beta-lactamase [Minicystis rosea]
MQTWSFDTTTSGWSQVASLPEPLSLPSLTAVGGQLFAGASTTQYGSTPEHLFYSYDPSENAWTGLPNPSQAPKYTPGLGSLTYTNQDGETVEQIVVWSGLDEGMLMVWDLGSASWTTLPATPNWGCTGGSVVVVGTQIFVFRTGTGPIDIAIYDVVSGSWSTRAYPSWMEVPPMTTLQTAVAQGTWVFSPNVYRLTVQYDTVNDQWYQQAGPSISGVPYLAAGACGSTLYAIYGGENACSFSAFGMPSGAWAERLQGFLGNGPMGWSFAVMKDGAIVDTAGWGFANAPWDGNVQFTPQTQIGFASCSKPITAVAAMKYYQDPSSTGPSWASVQAFLDDPFYPYVKSWIPEHGTNVDLVTLGQLLTMKSGMANFAGCYDPYVPYMTGFVQSNASPGTYQYINADFGIFQMILCNWNDGGKDPVSFYADYVQQNVFGPMGITGMVPTGLPTCTYAQGQTSGPGFVWPTLTSSTSSGGWGGTVLDLVGFLAGLRTEAVLTADNVEALLTNQLGCYPWTVTNGTAYWHNGGLINSAQQGLMTMAVRFPDGTDAAWVCNTQGPWDWYSALITVYNALNGAATTARPSLPSGIALPQ